MRTNVRPSFKDWLVYLGFWLALISPAVFLQFIMHIPEQKACWLVYVIASTACVAHLYGKHFGGKST